MAKARINSGFGREAKTKTAAPAKPQKVRLRSGFQAVTSGLNTSGTRQTVPHDATTSPSTTGSDLKLRKAGISPGKGRRMY